MSYFFAITLFLTSSFLILLVLIQRGRGGGLAGAFGGMGGQSAFGTKAGDLFTKITIGVATFWILLCLTADKYFATKGNLIVEEKPGSAAPAVPGSKARSGATQGET